MKSYLDKRGKHKKGRYALFFDFLPPEAVKVEIFSGLSAALKSMAETLCVGQSLHDSSGKLIAWTENGKLVQAHA